jgi:hypothetical protein
MAEEKELTLEDLGLKNEPTPAETAAQPKVVNTVETENGDKIQIVKPNIDVSKVENEWKPDEMTYIDKDNKAAVTHDRKIIRPNLKNDKVRNDRNAGYQKVSINSFAKTPVGSKKKEENPIRKTLDGLYELADQNIERTKQDLTRPGGRIDEAKHKYIDDRWALLQKRAKGSKSLRDHIKAIEDIMETDARFDGISEYLRKGYIIFKVAHDEGVGVNDETFGIETATREMKPRLSNEAAKEADAIIDQSEDNDDLLSNDKFVIGEDVSSEIPFMEETDEEEEVSMITEEENVETTKDNVNIPEKTVEEVKPAAAKKIAKVIEDNIPTKEEVKEDPDVNENIPTVDTTATTASDPSDLISIEGGEEEEENTDLRETTDEEELTEEQKAVMRKDLKTQIISKLNLNRTNDLEGFEISSRPISLNASIDRDHKIEEDLSVTWGLQYSGVAIEIAPFYGQELIKLNPEVTNFQTVAGLRTIFSLLYKHFTVKNKPKFETWLRQISDYDIDCMIFGAYYASFRDNNFLTYECPKCHKAFIEKKDCKDMVVYPNDKVKERFASILKRDTVGTKLYKTKPIKINDKYAVGFVTQSIYSNMFEPAALSDDFKKKYATIINIMPNIDRVYRINYETHKLDPIMFGVIECDITKTVQRKVKGLNTIISSFTPDERSLLIAEADKISRVFDADVIRYQIPSTVCPECGTKIKGIQESPLNLLFMRAQLPIVAASIPE